MTRSAAAKASSRSPRSWPPRLRRLAATASSSRSPEQPADARALLAPARQRVAELARRQAQEVLVLLVAHGVDAALEKLTVLPSEELPQAGPVLEHDRVPARAANMSLMRLPAMPGTTRSSDWRLRSTIQRTSLSRGTIGSDQRFPHGPLVELGVADEGDVPPRPGRPEMGRHVAVGDGAPDRRGGANADRPGGEIDRVGVLGPARVALEPTERPQLGQVALVEPPRR